MVYFRLCIGTDSTYIRTLLNWWRVGKPDYINRAMPANKPGSLTPDEVYAVVAFLFYRNGIIQESDVLDAKSLPKIEMPNRNGFVPAVPVSPPDPKKPSWF